MANNCTFSVYFKYSLCPLLLLSSVIAFIQNVIFCSIVWWNPILHKKSLILIVNLSISGIFNSVTVPVFEFVYVYFYPFWPLGKLGTNLQNAIWLFSLVLPFVTVTCITIERYLATVKGLRFHRTYVTPFNLGIVVLAIWIYSIAWTCSIASNFIQIFDDNNYVWNVPSAIYYVFLGIHLVVPLMVISVLYWLMLRETKKSNQQFDNQSFQRDKIETKLAKTIAMVIGCLYFVWVPVVLLEIVYNFDFSECGVEQAGSVSVWITSLNGCLYPVIYFYRIDGVWDSLIAIKMKILHCFCCFWKSDGKIMVDHPYKRIPDMK
jgi:7 transmembrane receptor (rhodopsin family).